MANTIERTLALKLVADVGALGKGLGQAQRRFGGTARSIAKWGKAFAGALVIGGIERLVDATTEGVKAFRDEQQSVRSFTKTAKNMRLPVRQATAALDRMADRAVNLGFDDGDVIRGMDAFLQQTGSIARASQLNALAMDVARSRQIDYSAAVRIAQNVYKGSARELDKYGISGVKGMEAVSRAREVERGKAAVWAKHHPMEVLLGKISDSWADVVGNLAQGNLGGALKAGQKLARQLTRGIFGWTDKEGKRHEGLWDRLFDASEGKDGRPKGIVNQLGQSIADEVGKVDWGKSLGEALTKGLDGLKASVESGGLAQVAAVGGAIATAMFAATLFIDAAKLVFTPGGWVTLAKGAVAATGAVLGWGLRLGMFVASRFVDAAALMMGTLSRDKILKGSAKGLGGSIGGAVLSGIIAGLTGAVAIGAVAQALTDLFASAETDWTKRGDRPLPESPFKWPWQEGGFFFPKGHAMGTAGAPRGWAWVGERGPELMRFRGGERVLDHRASMGAMGGSVVLNVNVNAPVAADGVRVGAEIMRYVDQALGGGHRFRNPVRSGT